MFYIKKLIADKEQDADYVGEDKDSREYDSNLYEELNLVERMLNKLKHFRSGAAHYDKLDSALSSFIHIAASMLVLIWV